jgi:hypothetical protein
VRWGWGGRGWGWGLGGGLAAGAIIGGALAAPYYYGGGYLLWRWSVLCGPRVRSRTRLLRGGRRWWRRRGVLHAPLQIL